VIGSVSTQTSRSRVGGKKFSVHYFSSKSAGRESGSAGALWNLGNTLRGFYGSV
jgi:hypothetical protein